MYPCIVHQTKDKNLFFLTIAMTKKSIPLFWVAFPALSLLVPAVVDVAVGPHRVTGEERVGMRKPRKGAGEGFLMEKKVKGQF